MFNTDPKSAALKNAMAKRRYNTVLTLDSVNPYMPQTLDWAQRKLGAQIKKTKHTKLHPDTY